MTEDVDNYPFKKSHTKIASSAFSDVHSYTDPLIVTKTAKKESGFYFPNISQSVSSIEGARKSRQEFVQEIEKLGSVPSLVPDEQYVIHNTPDNQITYSRTQTFYEDSPPLSQLNIFKLPRTSLTELRNIIKADYNIWRKTKHFNDIVGSSSKPTTPINRMFKNLFPIFYSENILLSPSGSLKFVDTGRLNNPKSLLDIKGQARNAIHLVGSVLSLVILDTTIMFKSKNKNKSVIPATNKNQIPTN